MRKAIASIFCLLLGGACLGSEQSTLFDAGLSVDAFDVGVQLDVTVDAGPGLFPEVVSDVAPDVTPDVVPDEGAEPDAPAPGLFTSIEVEPNPNSTLSALVHVVTAEEASVRIQFGNDEVGPFLTSLTPSGTAHDLVVVGMRANSTYSFQLIAMLDSEEVAGPSVDFTTGDLPLIYPFEVTVNQPALVEDGITFLGIASADKDPDPNVVLYIAVDQAGEVVWYYNDVNMEHSFADREVRPLPDGSLIISKRGGYRFIDLAGNTLAELKGGPSVGGPLHHDAVPMANGNFITLSTQHQTIDVAILGGPSLIKGDRVLEMIPPSEVVWSWSTFDHMDTQRFPSGLSQNQHPKNDDYDWTHGNGLQYLEADDAVLVSFRHQHWVVKIDRASGDILWTLGLEGDFTLISGEWFFGQHAPELHPDGRILIYDNGNDRPTSGPNYSRAVMFQLDFDAMTAEQIWSFQSPDYAGFLGDVDLLDNGRVLITTGGVLMGQPAQVGDSRILEVTQEDDPQIIWEFKALGGLLYRATRVESFWP